MVGANGKVRKINLHFDTVQYMMKPRNNAATASDNRPNKVQRQLINLMGVHLDPELERLSKRIDFVSINALYTHDSGEYKSISFVFNKHGAVSSQSQISKELEV